MSYSGNTGGGGIKYKHISDPDRPEGTTVEYAGDPGSEGESSMTYVINTWPKAEQTTRADKDKGSQPPD